MTDSHALQPVPSDDFLLYASEDGKISINVTMRGETVWLSQSQMAVLFDRDADTIGLHIRNLYEEGELHEHATTEEFSVVRKEGSRSVERRLTFYNLDVIISVGYRVKSLRGTQFRKWATERLREYLIKGFTMDDERLKQAGGGDYFDELLARIRDIRSSERVFWRKVLDIYATSIDYDPSTEASLQFFATIQNKMHWASHGHTAAEVISERVSAKKPNMGLTTWAGGRLRKSDVGIAKNYLNKDEMETLNLIVSAYLDFAELQAKSRKSMTMQGWIKKLDDFLRLTERDILSHAGKVSHKQAIAKAEKEYETFRLTQASLPQPVDVHFDEALQHTKLLEQKKATKPRPRSSKKKA
jgi:hypothetical protein